MHGTNTSFSFASAALLLRPSEQLILLFYNHINYESISLDARARTQDARRAAALDTAYRVAESDLSQCAASCHADDVRLREVARWTLFLRPHVVAHTVVLLVATCAAYVVQPQHDAGCPITPKHISHIGARYGRDERARMVSSLSSTNRIDVMLDHDRFVEFDQMNGENNRRIEKESAIWLLHLKKKPARIKS